MAQYKDREAFIPYRRTDIIDLCIEDDRLRGGDVQKFREFCMILSAYYHFKFHKFQETAKDNFASFNPDNDTRLRHQPDFAKKAEMEEELVKAFVHILERANYKSMSESVLQKAFDEESLVELNTKVDFNDFDRMLFFYRGDTFKTIQVKKFFKKIDLTVDVFERVVLLLKFKEASYFVDKKEKLDELNFKPGKIYLYYYKNIPKYDLELLFPNIKVSMTWKDLLLFGVPAVGAGISVVVKVVPQMMLIIGVIAFFLFGPQLAIKLGVHESTVDNIMPVLAATLSVVVTFGGLAFKQYSSYKSKKIQFQKNVTDTLFFRNLDNNQGVFNTLIDAAEEEECKEIILVYYHLLTGGTPMKPEELDNRIEEWMDKKFGVKIDFDIEGPIHNLESIRGKIVRNSHEETALLTRDHEGKCIPLPLDDAKAVIDSIWDNIFQYESNNYDLVNPNKLF